MDNKRNSKDELSLALHAAVKRELISDPERVLDAARKNLRRWSECYDEVPVWMSDWTEIIERGVEAVVRVLDGRDEASTLLRSSSPFTGVISQTERLNIINDM